jgi:O-succinylbenzoic acid--CoA ligase
MDAALLTDPSFWSEPRPFVPGGFDGGLPDIPALDCHVLFQTSGSSGVPKWIALPKEALLISAACVNRHLQVTEDSCWGLPLPLHHVGGFGVMARVFEAACGHAVFGRRWDAVAFQEFAGENSVTHTSLVPTQVHDLVYGKLRAPESLRAIVVGGGRLEIPLGQAARDLGWPVLASYGMTEACSQIATQPLELLGMPYNNASIPLLDIWEARVDEGGLLEISGPSLFSGTLRHDGARWAYTARDGGWHRTSDKVLLESRMITPLGRADTLVKVLGELVDPEAIERELVALSGGKLVAGTFAVAAVADDRAEHRLVPVADPSVDEKALRAALSTYAAEAPGFRRLQDAVFVQLLPRSPLGKLLRGGLGKLIP